MSAVNVAICQQSPDKEKPHAKSPRKDRHCRGGGWHRGRRWVAPVDGAVGGTGKFSTGKFTGAIIPVFAPEKGQALQPRWVALGTKVDGTGGWHRWHRRMAPADSWWVEWLGKDRHCSPGVQPRWVAPGTKVGGTGGWCGGWHRQVQHRQVHRRDHPRFCISQVTCCKMATLHGVGIVARCMAVERQ